MHMASAFTLLIAGVILLQATPGQNAEHQREQAFIVTPTDAPDCQGEQQCQTLETYLQNVEYYFNSNTTFWFLPGIHRVSWPRATSAIIRNVTDLTLTGVLGDYGVPSVTIHCNWSIEFCFKNIQNLVIANIEFNSCGFWRSESECPVYIKSFSVIGITIKPHLMVPAALKVVDSNQVTFTNVSIRDSYKYGLIGSNVLRLFLIDGCTFSNNSWGLNKLEFNKTIPWDLEDYIPWKYSGGNALFLYDETASQNDKWHGLKINHSEIEYGVNYEYCQGPVRYQSCGGAGVGIFLKPVSPGRLPQLYIVLEHTSFHDNTAQDGANLYVYHDYDGYKQPTNVYIHNCTFYNGRALRIGGGVHIDLTNEEPTITRDSIRITNSIFFNNSAGSAGGGLALSYGSQNGRSLTSGCIFMKDCLFSENEANYGAGVYASLVGLTTATCVHVLYVSQSTFSHNIAADDGGGFNLHLPTTLDDGGMGIPNPPPLLVVNQLTRRIVLNNSLFRDNRAETGSAMRILACEKEDYNRYPIFCDSAQCIKTFNLLVFVQCTEFSNNSGPNIKTATVLDLHSMGYVKLVSSVFIGNTGSSVLANQSNIYTEGDLVFANNMAYTGGALHLACNSLSGEVSGLHLFPKTNIFIANNTALQYGGGITANEECNSDTWCFFQIELWSNGTITNFTELAKVIMDNNTAVIAGDSLYGGPIHDCFILAQDSNSSVKVGIDIFKSIFEFNGGQHYFTEVASTPFRICFCQDQSPDSHCLTNVTKNVFQGQEFHFSAIVSGSTRGAYAAAVRTIATSDVNTAVSLGTRQTVQQLGRSCGNLTYSVRTSTNHVRLHLTVESILHLRDSPTFINVTILPCPFGFQSLGEPASCDCLIHLLRIAGVTCDINTQVIHRPANVWIGNYSGDIVAHSNCPFDYCKDENDISPLNQDIQCALNRSGVLCGRCQHGLSLALGTSTCLPCSNYYIFLIIPFLLAGLILLLLLLKCNLTVSVGTINGLIFYANIVHANRTIYFPHGSSTPLVHILSVFIAWLNLDLGIETCFFSGMDAYAKSWLQFLFPAYIWIIMGALVYSSRYSVRVSKLTGSNPVPVLATLFLLSYAKLLRTAFAAVSPITITDKHGKQSLLWLLDGNVQFMGWPHAALFVMALLAVFTYLVPLTLLTLFAPRLQAWSGLAPLRWVRKIKPLLDAYQGPYKLKYRYWTGLMLVVRLILFTVFSANALGDPKINLLTISLMLTLLLVCVWNIGVVYKKYPVHLLEEFYILNIAVFSVSTLYLKGSQASQESQESLACTMVGSAFLVFLTTLAWHLYDQTSQIHKVWQVLTYCYRRLHHQPQSDEVPDHPLVPIVQPQPTFSVIDLSRLRESMLTDN